MKREKTLLERSRNRRRLTKAKPPRCRRLFLEVLEDRRLLSAKPTVTLNVPAAPFIGTSPLVIQATFDNTSATLTDVGYGPFIDIVFPVNGADGNAGTDTPDGISPISGATYLGQPLTTTELTFPDDGFGTGCVAHPYAVDNTNTPLQVCGTAGDMLVVVQLPFGSFTPDQPPATIELQAELSNLADLGVGLPFLARGGFRYGEDPLNNPSVDPTLFLDPDNGGSNSALWTTTAITTPTVMRMTKTYVGPENETATGPNFPRQYVLSVSIAPGQTVTDLDIFDGFDNNIVVTGITFPLAVTAPETPFGPANIAYPNGLLLGTVASVLGTGGSDVVVTIDFYVPEFDANGNRIIPLDGTDPVPTENRARSMGSWDPIDPRDVLDDPQTATAEPSPNDPAHRLQDKSLAIQKSVVVVGGGDPAPGRELEYTLSFQISDYFTFGDLFVTDTFSDGQNFFDEGNNPVYIPSFTVSDRRGTTSGDFVLGETLTHVFDGLPDATETLVFNLSKALQDALGTNHSNGILVGGLATEPDDRAAVGTVTFRVLIPNNYDLVQPAGGTHISQGDSLTNEAWIAGTVRDNSNPGVTIGTESDDTAAGVSISYGRLQKSIYAVNGVSPPPPNFVVAPGDSVTYCLVYTKPITSFNNLVLRDFLPLPVFNVSDPLADGLHKAWEFNEDSKDPANRSTPPAPGFYQIGPLDTLYDYTDESSTGFFNPPTIDDDGVSNSLTFNYGTYDSSTNSETVLHVLFTIRANDSPFADGLFLTNIVRAFENNSAMDESIEDAIVRFQLGQPALNITKGVVATDHPAPPAEFVPAPPVASPLTITPPGTSGFRFSDTVTSDYLSATPRPLDSNLQNVDAGDLVTFVIVVENTGSSRNGAFDIRVRDVLPAGFSIPGAGELSDLNLSVTDGTGATIEWVRVNTSETEAMALFGSGIELVDPGPTPDPIPDPWDGTDGGALDQYNATSGRNILVITYDLIAQTSVQPRETIVNTATLTSYAGDEGGENHVPLSDQPSDEAEVTIADPTLIKAVTATSVPETGSSQHTPAVDLVIGEQVTYQMTITLREGTTVTTLTDDLPDVLIVVSSRIVSIGGNTTVGQNFGGNITGSLLAIGDPGVHNNVNFPGDGLPDQVVFAFGTLVNAPDNVEDFQDEIVVEVVAIVADHAANADSQTKTNTATLDYGSGTVNATADVDIVEPVLLIDKQVFPFVAGGLDEVTYTILVSHADTSTAPAYHLVIEDLLTHPYLSVDVGSVTFLQDDGINTAVVRGNTGGATDMLITADRLDLGGVIEFTFTVTLPVNVVGGA